MTNKILVIVVVPMIEEEYNIYIPVSKSINVTIELLVKTINELSEGHYQIKNNAKLISSNGEIFPRNYTVKASGIKNGDKIILI